MNGSVAAIGARIDALQTSKRLWVFVALIAAGGFFEIYDLSLTAPISSGLVAAGIFRTGHAGLFGLADQATFILATFSGLYLGVVGFAVVGDRLGRKVVFGYSLIWYALATLVMGLQDDVLSVCFWRFVAGIGLGAEAVAIDCYVVEIVPRHIRGRAFSLSMCVQYCAIPTGALLGALLIPEPVLHVAGWRWMAFVPVIGAVGFWLVRRNLPESPRWLAARGRFAEANVTLDRLGAPNVATGAATRPAEAPPKYHAPRGYIRRTIIMLLVYTNLQNIAYYGFSNWLPTLLTAQGVPLKDSLFYNFGVSMAAPVAALALGFFSDSFERKHLIVGFGASAIVLGMLFGWTTVPIGWLIFGVGLRFSNSLLSVVTHNYFSEVFPTELRARAVGFVYSFTRISAAISGYIIAWTLDISGVKGVFVLISGFMLIGIIAVQIAGPRTRNRTFEEITGETRVGVAA